MTQDPVLDNSALERLREWGGPQLVAQIIDVFLETAPGRVQRAREAERTGDLKMLAHQAHSLKTSAGYLGATEMLELVADIERRARAEETAELAELVHGLEQAYTRLQGRLAAVRGCPE
ncbi:MAG: Hpt domain-containing protein [Gemmatimonadetes bacterium]|nr:Hpt domain-containing protein [Gemmatimonadota bacterium]